MPNPNSNSFVTKLRKYLNGSISADELMDGQEYMDDIDEMTPRGKSVIYFDIDWGYFEENFFQEGDAWFIKSVTDLTRNYDIWDYDLVLENWTDGGIIYEFGEDGKRLYNQISNLLNQSNEPVKNHSTSAMEVNGNLLTSYPSEIEGILDLYVELKNVEAQRASRDAVLKETDEIFGNEGIGVDWEDGFIKINASTLYVIFRTTGYDGEQAMEGLIDVMNEIAEEKKFHGWDESRWEFEDPKYFDSDEFNEKIEEVFEYIKNDLMDNMSPDYLKIRKLLMDITNGDIYKEINTKGYVSRIHRFNPIKGTLVLKLYKSPDGSAKWGKVSPEMNYQQFRRYLENPSEYYR